MALDERSERGEPGRVRDLTVRSGLVAQRADEAVDLADRVARHLLDRLERRARAGRVALLEQPRGAGLDEDHVDRVAGGVVQVAGDARALLDGCEPALALAVSLGRGSSRARGAAVSGRRRTTRRPDEHAEEERHGRHLALPDADGGDVRHEEADGDGGRAPVPRVRVVPARGEQVERDGRPERRPGGEPSAEQHVLATVVSANTAERRAAPDDERQRRDRGQHDAGRVDARVRPRSRAARERGPASRRARPRRSRASSATSLRSSLRRCVVSAAPSSRG